MAKKIKVVKSSNHLGVPLSSNGSNEHEMVLERVQACRRTFYAAKTAASSKGVTDALTLSKLYFTLCI